MYEAVNDPTIRPAIEAFLAEQKKENTELLLRAVRMMVRDTMKEARIAGKVEAYEDCLRDLENFSKKNLQEASQ